MLVHLLLTPHPACMTQPPLTCSCPPPLPMMQAVQARARAKQLKKQQEGQQGGSPDAGWSNSGGTGGG